MSLLTAIHYKTAIVNIRENQKRLISNKLAVYCTTKWSVDGSQSKGQAITNRNIRLTLRVFNNVCDAAVANTRWNNVNAMEKRVLRAKEQIEKLNASNAIFISTEFKEDEAGRALSHFFFFFFCDTSIERS